jgi:hypothetical protein
MRNAVQLRVHCLQPISFIYPAAATLIFILSCLPASAQIMVRPVNLAYLSQRGDVIVQGRVIEVLYENLPGYSHTPTVKVTLDVEKMLRGPAGKTYSFREILLGPRSKKGKGSYQAGQRLVLFLTSPSGHGLSSPVGIEQGRFHIGLNSRGSTVAVNEHGNTGLFKDVEQTARKAGLRLTTKQSQIIASESGPVLLDDFIPLIKNLTSLPRIR